MDHEGGLIFGGTVARSLESGGGQWLFQGGGGFRDRPGVSIPGDGSGIKGDPELLSADGDLRLNSDVQHKDAFVSNFQLRPALGSLERGRARLGLQPDRRPDLRPMRTPAGGTDLPDPA